MNILVLNGPNLNMLGIREPNVYGEKTYQDLENTLQDYASEKGITLDIKQSNFEGVLIDLLHYAHEHFDGVILNAGALTHYSYALHDAIKSIGVPVIEVHLSDISKREIFRQHSVIKDACLKTFQGNGFSSYLDGIKYLIKEEG
ncbi:MAG: type II 3-dehydroquinate dehydratase [Candidatus Izemoplasma sp.]|nr:type II 3-dehydroquinate dehydratase [Candidatus Izemoplasma sp.]